jgi:hypothetical protein
MLWVMLVGVAWELGLATGCFAIRWLLTFERERSASWRRMSTE